MTRRSSKGEPAGPTNPPTWDEKLITALRPWGREIGGILVFLVAAISLFGLLGLIHTTAVAAWSSFLWIWLGWVSLPAALFIALLGLYNATWRLEHPYHPRPAVWIGSALALVAFLPLTHLLAGTTLPESQLGQGGGRLGYALGEPVHYFFGTAAAYLAYLALLWYAIALITGWRWVDSVRVLRRLAAQLRGWARSIAPEDAGRAANRPEPRPVIDRRKMEKIKREAPPTAPRPPVRRPVPVGPVEIQRRHPLLPPVDMLLKGGIQKLSADEIEAKRQIIQKTLDEFNIPAEVLPDPLIGPSVTQFAVVPGYDEREMPDGSVHRAKVRVNRIAALDRDMALALAAPRIRIQAPVPGQGIVGVEVPNSAISTVRLGTVIESAEFQKIQSGLGMALGLDVSGAAVAADIAKLPHMLVAGQTGSGKSVFINAIVACLVFNNTPETLNLVMIDPKRVELIRFNGLPHLLGKVETDGERAIGVLRWLMGEMDDRYRKLSEMGARHIEAYNKKIRRHPGVKTLPTIVALVDELADLMVQYGAELERALCRLAQMARAVGIHLIIATQRPSTDVITGLIKANFPSRASFAVASGIDSRVILDSNGAETLLGRGDMLFLSSDASTPQRLQGCFVSDDEIDRLVRYWQEKWPEQRRGPAPWDNLIERQAFLGDKDDLLERAVALAQKYDAISTSMLQRRLRIGFPRASKIMEDLYEMGLVEDPKIGGATRRTLVDDGASDPLRDFLTKHGEDYIDYPDKPDFDNP